MKKSLSVAMVVAMVSSMFASMAFADDAATTTTTSTPSTPQEKYDALVKAGIFDADGTGNGADLNGLTTRAQIAKIIAKVYNLSDDAASASTFKDLDGSGWATGYIGAVAKAKYMEGRADGVFAPTANVKLEELAIILARAFNLDTKASTDVGSGNVDDWAKGAVAAALKAGLIPASTDFTKEAIRSDLATSAFAAVAKAKADADAAAAAEAAKKIKVASVASVSNTRTLVTFDKDASAAGIQASDFTVKDSAGTAVTVSAAKLRGDKVGVLVDTAALTAGSSYTISYKGGDAQSFVAKPADGTAPTVVSAQALTNQIVRVVFNKDVDVDTLVQGNIAIDNSLTVNSVALDTDFNADTVANSAGNVAVLVGTTAQTAGTLYTVTASNVKDVAGNAISSSANTYKFAGAAADTTAPAVQLAQANDDGTITVTFTEATQLDATSATTASNYTINGLTVKSATVASNKLNGTKSVTLAVNENMTAGNLYTVSVLNVADIYGNKITTASTSNFAGVALRTSAVSLQTAVATTNTNVELTFNYDLDAASVVPANFTFDNSLTASAAAFGKNSDGSANKKVVEVTTNAQTAGQLYTATVANVKDKLGNALSTTAYTAKFAGVAADSTGPSVSSASSTAANTVVVNFNEKLDSATATNVLNYSINNGLGYPTAATLDPTGKIVTLTVGNMAPGTLYTVTVKNVKDVAGNVLGSTNSATFPGVASSATVKVSAAVALNNKQLKVVFNQPVNAAQAANLANYKIARTDGAANTTSDIATGAAGNYATIASIDAGAKALVQPDGSTVIIEFNNVAAVGMQAGVYSLEYSVGGKFGATADAFASADAVSFAGLTSARADIKISNVQAIDTTHIKVLYSEPVKAASVDTSKFSLVQDDNKNLPAITGTSAAVDVTDANGNVIGHTITLSSALTAGKVYDITVGANNNIIDAFNTTTPYGLKLVTSGYDAYLTTVGVAAVSKVNVSAAAQTESNVVTITFDQPIKSIAYTNTNANAITVVKDDGSTVVATGQEIVSGTNSLKVYFNNDITGSTSGVYTVKVGAALLSSIIYAYDTTNLINLGVSGATTSYVFAKSLSDAAPTVSSVVATASNVAKVTFSESIKTNGASAATDGDFKLLDQSGNVIPTSFYTIYTDSGLTSALGQFGTTTVAPVNALYVQLTAGNFGQGQSYKFVVTGNKANVTDLAGNRLSAAGSSDATTTFSGIDVGDVAPDLDATTPFVVANGTGTGGAIDAGDTLTIKFSKAVDPSKVTLANLVLNNSHNFGTGATVTTTDNQTFVVTLGTTPTIAAADTITIAKANVVDLAGKTPAADVVLTVPAATSF